MEGNLTSRIKEFPDALKEQKTYFLICSLSLCFSLSAIAISIPVYSQDSNFSPAPVFGKIISPDQTADTLNCLNEILDFVLKFARFDHSEGGNLFYSLKLSMLSSGFERYYFYQNAWEHEFYMADKGEFYNDSAIFLIGIPVKERVLSLISELYMASKNASHSFSENEKNEVICNSPFYHQIHLHGPPYSPPYIGCDSSKVACSSNTYSFPSGTQGQAPPPVNGYPNYGCLGSYPGPAWYFMQIGQAGDIIITISQNSGPPNYIPHDVDFICWGPFNSLSDGCSSGLTGTCGNGRPPFCCSNNMSGCTNFYPRGNITDCSFSPSATETCHILNAQVGEIYILLITNFSMQPGIITFSQTGGSGVTNCNIVVHCSIIAISTDTTSCNPLTNTFSVSGNIEFSNPSPTGTLTITDNTASPPISQTFSSPFTSPQPYNLTNIPCDGLIHSLTAVFSDSLNCNLTQQYTSPSATCPQAHISGEALSAGDRYGFCFSCFPCWHSTFYFYICDRRSKPASRKQL